MKKYLATALTLALAMSQPSYAATGPLKLGVPVPKPTNETVTLTCPAPVAVPKDLYVPEKYVQSGAHDVINTATLAANLKAREPIDKARQQITGLTNLLLGGGNAKIMGSKSAILAGNKQVLSCLISVLNAHAARGVLTGKLTGDATDLREFFTASTTFSFALAARYATANDDNGKIAAWLRKLIDASILEQQDNLRDRKTNNHSYWVAFSAATHATVTQDMMLFAYAMNVAKTGLASVDGAGLLPREAARGTRALSYQNFALIPLSYLTLMARSSGTEDLRDVNDKALGRAVVAAVDGIKDPKAFAKAVVKFNNGKLIEQDMKEVDSDSVGWGYAIGELYRGAKGNAISLGAKNGASLVVKKFGAGSGSYTGVDPVNILDKPD